MTTAGMNRRCGRPIRLPGTTVLITTTMMSGETSRFTDDYGTLVPDVTTMGCSPSARRR